MIKLSSSITIFLKLFFPLFWLIFFGSLTLAIWISTPAGLDYTRPYFKWLWTLIFLAWTAVLYFTVFKIKRVEGGHEGLHVSNYFKHIFIPLTDIRSFEETSFGPFLLVKVHFMRPTLFGRRIFFIASKARFSIFVRENADRIKNDLPGT
ncbi:MAG: hypothetical protein R3275_04715 [Saprospiraceae bacterium]|nr:hypothetical protein [Saprospiraceae bacterium]